MISIVIGTFGSEDWLRRGTSLGERSRLQFPDTEIIQCHTQNLARSRNLGAKEASGEWLCFLDADDHLGDSYIESMERLVPEYPALIQPATLYFENIEDIPRLKPSLLKAHSSLSRGNWMVIGTLIRRDQFLDLGGFDEGLPIYEDWDLWIRATLDGAVHMVNKDAVYYVQKNVDSRNNQPGNVPHEWFKIIHDRYYS